MFVVKIYNNDLTINTPFFCQAARLREDIHNMGSLYMSEICTEMKNLRSLVRVCEIQATLREQR